MISDRLVVVSDFDGVIPDTEALTSSLVEAAGGLTAGTVAARVDHINGWSGVSRPDLMHDEDGNCVAATVVEELGLDLPDRTAGQPLPAQVFDAALNQWVISGRYREIGGLSMDGIPGVEGTFGLLDDHFDAMFHIITKRPDNSQNRHEVHALLWELTPGIVVSGIQMIGSSVHPGNSRVVGKGEPTSDLGADLFIDDHEPNVDDVARVARERGETVVTVVFGENNSSSSNGNGFSHLHIASWQPATRQQLMERITDVAKS